MKVLFICFILIANSLFAEDVKRGELKKSVCDSEKMTTCTEEFLVQDQIFIDKYGGKGKKSSRQTVQLKN